jgi:phosphoglycerate dehydrogenase-like enzyme
VSGPRIAIVPSAERGLREAVLAGGGQPSHPSEADGLVWTTPSDLDGLKATLAASPARWVQLPFAGVESFFAAGVIDPKLTWTCTKGAYGPSTAEHALALILAAARRIHLHARQRAWRRDGSGSPARTLDGAVAVIVGTGGIGTALADMLVPLRARVIGVNRSGTPLEGAERTGTTPELPELVHEADFVVVAAALTDETRGLFGADLLARMAGDAWLVNVARGGLVDTEALLEVLREGAIGGAALDVTDPEPLPEGHPLWDLDNVIITPHVANTWDMALPALRRRVERNVARFAAGKPLEGLVDYALGY